MTDPLKQFTLVADAKHKARVADAAAKATAQHCDDRIEKYEKLCSILLFALQRYADPGFYHAITIIGDRPTGGFDEDISRVQGSVYNRPMPGKFARKALRDAEKLIDKYPDAFDREKPAALPPSERNADENTGGSQ